MNRLVILFIPILLSCSKKNVNKCEQWETVTTCKNLTAGYPTETICRNYPRYETLPTCGDDLQLAREGKTKLVYSGVDRVLTRVFIKKVN